MILLLILIGAIAAAAIIGTFVAIRQDGYRPMPVQHYRRDGAEHRLER